MKLKRIEVIESRVWPDLTVEVPCTLFFELEGGVEKDVHLTRILLGDKAPRAFETFDLLMGELSRVIQKWLANG